MLNRLKELVGITTAKDALEWDANDPAGDESAYDGRAVLTIPYDHAQFVEATNGN
jgi:hypothetical protein